MMMANDDDDDDDDDEPGHISYYSNNYGKACFGHYVRFLAVIMTTIDLEFQ